MSDDQRKHTRKDVITLTFLSIDTKGVAKTVNVSAGGIKVEMRKDLLYGSIAETKILTSDGSTINAKGYITRIEELDDKLALAIKFTEVNEKDKNLLDTGLKISN
jgi:hypothetical protein